MLRGGGYAGRVRCDWRAGGGGQQGVWAERGRRERGAVRVGGDDARVRGDCRHGREYDHCPNHLLGADWLGCDERVFADGLFPTTRRQARTTDCAKDYASRLVCDILPSDLPSGVLDLAWADCSLVALSLRIYFRVEKRNNRCSFFVSLFGCFRVKT